MGKQSRGIYPYVVSSRSHLFRGFFRWGNGGDYKSGKCTCNKHMGSCDSTIGIFRMDDECLDKDAEIKQRLVGRLISVLYLVFTHP